MPPFQSYVYGAVPLFTVRSMLPFALPHVASADVLLSVGPAVLLIVTVVVAAQPFTSVTFTVYEPAAILVKSCVVYAPPFQSYVYGAVPLFTVRSMLPFALPHVASADVLLSVGPAVLLIVTVVVAAQPFTSVTFTV